MKTGAKCFVHATNPAFDHVHYRYLKFPWTWGGRADGRDDGRADGRDDGRAHGRADGRAAHLASK